MMYSAKSIVNALKASEELSCEDIDKLGCPSPVPHEGCLGNPKKCNLCINQSCKQRVPVFRKHQKMIVLDFRFMVSLQNPDGFIRSDDSALNTLLSRKWINKSLLKYTK